MPVYREPSAVPQDAESLETPSEFRRKPFGADSDYYRLYRRSPAEARKALWAVYLACGRRVQTTAKKLGCSRDTVRAVVRRASAAGRVLWDNRPTRPFDVSS